MSNEVRNPRYAGATIRDVVRSLMKPRKAKKPKTDDGETIELDGSQVRFQRDRDEED